MMNLKKMVLEDLYPARIIIVVSLLLYIPVTGLNIIQPLIIGYAVDQSLHSSEANIVFYAVIFFLTIMVLAVSEMLQSFLMQKSGQIFIRNLRQRAFEKVQRLSMSHLDSTPTGKILTRLVNDPELLVEVFSSGAIQVVSDVFFLLGTVVMLLLVNVKLSLYAFLSFPFLIIGMQVFRHFIKKAFVIVRQSLSDLNSFLSEYLMGIEVLQIFNDLENSLDKFSKQNEHYFFSNKRAIFYDAAIYSFVEAMSFITCAFVILGADSLRAQGALQLGVLVAFIQALNRFFQPIKEFSYKYSVIQSSMVSLGRVYEVLLWPEEKHVLEKEHFSFKDKIRFDKVSFSYKKATTNTLMDVSFTVNKGEQIALIGKTGAGKSTVIKLLNRFYELNEGRILIDGQDISTIPLGNLRRLITVVPQEVFLFKGSLKDNLSFGKLKATDEEIWQALTLVQMKDFVMNRGGLSCQVDYKGSNFSQGQKQLFAFARAIVADYPIIILDEATANVDVKTESKMRIATKNLLKNKTAIIIAHRLSTIKDCHKIALFKEGKLVKMAAHEDLMADNQEYRKMMMEQK